MSKKKKEKKEKQASSIEIKNGWIRLGKHYVNHAGHLINYQRRKK